jgi:hypothetical protein
MTMEVSDTTMTMIDPIQTDRPDQTETAYLVPKGYFQMEHGFSIEDTEPGFIYTYPSSLWKYGINDNFEVRLTTEYTHIQRPEQEDVKGFSPFSLGMKTKLCEGRGIIPQTAFIGHLYFPTIGNDEFDITYFAPDMRLAFFHDVSEMFAISYNVGAAWNGESAEPDFLYSLSLALSVSDEFGLYAELYGDTPQREDDDMELRADAGITYRIGNNFQLDVSAGKGITDNAPESYVAMGFSYRFEL